MSRPQVLCSLLTQLAPGCCSKPPALLPLHSGQCCCSSPRSAPSHGCSSLLPWGAKIERMLYSRSVEAQYCVVRPVKLICNGEIKMETSIYPVSKEYFYFISHHILRIIKSQCVKETFFLPSNMKTCWERWLVNLILGNTFYKLFYFEAKYFACSK